MKKALRLQSD